MGSDGADDYTLFVDPFEYANFQKNRESVRQLDAVITESKIGVKALEVATAMGAIKIMSEQDCEPGCGRVFATSEIYSRCAGDDPMDLVGNGGLLTYQNEDKRQGRIGSYGNYFWENPGNSLIIDFTGSP
jgi:hypothetical protein